jgi:uroporphyrinogen decarboxylase
MENPPVNDLFVRAARGEQTERTPIWMMRQAGRTDPEYLRLRDASGLPLEALFRNPEFAAKCSLLPKRIGVDAIIFYQDILTPLSPMGADFVFAPGPLLHKPLDTSNKIDALATYEVEKHLPFVRETFERIQEQLRGELPVLGFAGAPLTLAVFILEGGSFKDSAPRTEAFLREHPGTMHRLLDKLTAMTIDYLRYQSDCGAVAVQLFESAAFVLEPGVYREFALPYQKRICDALKGTVPTIIFARDWANLQDLDDAGADIISLPASISISAARAQLGRHRVFQGNLDNRLLVDGTKEQIEEAALRCVADGEHRGHIFNLSHGLLRETPFENVVHLVNTVRAAIR